ncbi:MAG: D-alanyl-D-alanine carboxypeptidase/D-alanyl-D-alanine-endopeptidase, partial [Candidatus Eremiobacteraeota bacterium]|nr:D-alanyl-D-alanine carboxypeptidase/D-alanyl-D-alanine-endopeptidase [Candidatus Eremiobacteraeota bacterium]
GLTPPGARVLWHHRSSVLRELLARMWLPSDNLLAESLLEELGTSARGPGDARDRGIARERTWLRAQGIDPSTLTIADGSGLSQYDRVTPAALVTLLRNAWSSAERQTILDALPMAGTRGTLKDAFPGSTLRGAVIAKTGSMSHVRTLAGFVVRPGRTLVFALLVNDWMDTSANAGAAIRLAQERFLEAAEQAATTHP